MNLKRLFNWNKGTEDQVENVAGQEKPNAQLEKDVNQASNVISLMTPPTELNDQDQIGQEVTEKPTPTKGLMNSPEIVSFFKSNYYGLGQHNGSNFRTQDALDLGKKSVVSKFQNTIADLLETKQTKINKLKNQLVAIEGLSTAMTLQLKQACDHLDREIRILNEQIDKAETQKGWVLKALNEYQIGFMKGVSDAIEFELLAN